MSGSMAIKEKQLKAIENGRGIQYILDTAATILENPIMFHDMEYKLIARTRNTVTVDPIWKEFERDGFVGSKRLEFYKDEFFFESLANTDKITLLRSDELEYDRLVGKVFNKERLQVGVVSMLGCYKPLEDYDPELFEYFCDLFTAEISQDEIYSVYGRVYLEKLISELIDGSIKDRRLYSAHVESINMHLKANIYLAVVDIGQPDATYAMLNNTRKMFEKLQPKPLYAVYSKYVLIFISTDSAKLRVKRDLKELNTVLVENDMRFGISSCFDNLYELYKYFAEAVSALDFMSGTHDDERIFLYDDIF